MTCTTLPEGILASSLEKIANEATKKTVDAFQDELYNAIIDLCDRMDTKFPRDNAVTDGGYFVQMV
ncbi:hypothetical protein DPMN_105885 [Dreissena polymorpha]|uniref:Uncharacterized protein n=1 Tax=Dreissena polymorpha TaxID=45954 RepID=A0A9D4K400_DREPO|nr:hypothetical protein DPMN_105885 [Dreissena polymorpha]